VTDPIRNAVNDAKAYLSAHPDEAHYRDSEAVARLGGGLRVDVNGPGGETLRTDMPKGIGGGALATSPGWYFRAAAAACVASLIGIRAAELGLELPPKSVEVVVDTESDDRGILGLDPSIPAGALSIKVVVRLDAPKVNRADLEALARWAVDHCPVTDTATRQVPLELELRLD
jgi:uncharacterized OsmC-like protein